MPAPNESFAKYACWQVSDVNPVIRTDADTFPAHVFRAVHSPRQLTVRQPGGRTYPMEPELLLEQFCDPTTDYRQLIILGEAGSGKSHFIRWMELDLERRPGALVLSIAKSGLSLRGVVQRLVEAMPPGKQQEEFRQRLAQVADMPHDQREQRQRVCQELSQVLRNAPPLAGLSAAEQTLCKMLWTLFQDVEVMLSHFEKDDSIIAQLARHVFHTHKAGSRQDEAREFRSEDFQFAALQLPKAAAPTRPVLQRLIADQGGASRRIAADFVNQNLPQAIQGCLRFRGEDLSALMNELRRWLSSQSQELILLIEDLTMLQGLDQALLNTLIAQTDDRGRRTLGVLRWAAAVTTGYFEGTRLRDTVDSRTWLYVDMNRAFASENERIAADVLTELTVRYLNAVRVGEKRLIEWHENQDDEGGRRPPNACENCGYQEPCHTGFGAVEGIGLYPFTQMALMQMESRLFYPRDQRFNLRQFLNQVTKPLLIEFRDHLVQGVFPPREFLERLGGPQFLTAATQTLLEHQNRDLAPRWITLLDLWHGQNEITGLRSEIHTAFGLQEPRGGPQEPDKPGTKPEPPPDTPSPPTRLDNDIARLEEWGNDRRVPDSALENRLRMRLFHAIVAHVDWDDLGLFQNRICRLNDHTAPFSRTSIRFQELGGETSTLTPVTLNIPADEADPRSRRQAAMALQALLLFDHHGHWQFENGALYLRTLVRELDGWSAEIVAQLRALFKPRADWDPVIAATELLAVGAALHGRLDGAETDVAAVLNAAFEEWPKPEGGTPEALLPLAAQIRERQELLTTFVRSLRSGTKGFGAQPGPFIAGGRLVPAVADMPKSDWYLRQAPPTEQDSLPTSTLRDIAKLYSNVQKDLRPAAEQVVEEIRKWLGTIRTELPHNESSGGALYDRLSELLQRVEHAEPVPVSEKCRDLLRRNLREFNAAAFDQYMERATRLDRVDNAVSALPLLAHIDPNVGFRAAALLESAALLIEDGLAGIQRMQTEDREAGQATVQGCRQAIESKLRELDETFKTLLEA